MAAAVLMPMISFRDESTHGDWQVLGRDEPKKKILVKQASMIQSERDISMDPISIKSLTMSPSLRRNDSFDMVLLPAMSPPRDIDAPMPLPLQPVRTKSSRSLPNSAATSPKQRSGLMRALKGREQDSSSGLLRALKSKDQDSSSGLMRALKRKEQDSSSSSDPSSGLMRAFKGKEQDSSPSSGLMRALKGKEQDSSSGLMRALKGKEQYSSSSSASFRRSNSCVATSKRLSPKSSGNGNSFLIKTESSKSINNNNTLEDGFKCNALCLYLPGFGKGKPVRSLRKDDSSSFTQTTTTTSSASSSVTVSRTVSVRETTTTTTVISARASMEKFDCGSYTSDSTGDEGGGHFDLPSELIKSGSGENDQDDPVSTAFVFDKEPIEKEIKGVLKVSGSSNRRSMETSLRHVRFSTSSPVSYPTSPAISPRLLEATKNFNAFLDAQAV
ncbi:hypothetical protein AALP_AA6G136600 [Arabis alpina]|uniref:Uncharacterized protein n=1 Tax=Arabis alpina TaxID=50452 RepID=A0A087GP17_ARAAL|nr:hypothetical protein AALP_AA6G136600 [Arabis alpina]